ncbi:hypothetical protein A4G99_16510 [Haladaptatus sp. R4]|nr:hypothetical protein A4G99_16510 [Haladaptatus sp. R4]
MRLCEFCNSVRWDVYQRKQVPSVGHSVIPFVHLDMIWRTTKRAETSKPVTKRTASERGKLNRRVSEWTKPNHVTTRTKQMNLDTREKKIRTRIRRVTVVGATSQRSLSFSNVIKKKRVTGVLRQRLVFVKGILLKKVPRILMASMRTMCSALIH